MAYDEKLANRIRERLSGLSPVSEKKMMGGLTFMYHDKMCVGIIKGELMCRIHPGLHETAILRKGCRTMDFTGRPMKGYILIENAGIQSQADFEYYIQLALDYNKKAKSSRKSNNPTQCP